MGGWLFIYRDGVVRLAEGICGLFFLNQMSHSRSIIIYVEEKKDGAGQWRTQTPKHRSKTDADASALCHFQCAKERLET